MHFKKSINHRSFYIQGLRSFKDTLPKKVKKILNKKGYIYSDIISNWNYLVGSKISKVSYPKSFRPNENNLTGILFLKVQRGSEIDVEYSKSEIMNKINSHFGYKIINKINFETFEVKFKSKKNINYSISNKSKNRFLKSINHIKNEKVKNSLLKLTKHFK